MGFWGLFSSDRIMIEEIQDLVGEINRFMAYVVRIMHSPNSLTRAEFEKVTNYLQQTNGRIDRMNDLCEKLAPTKRDKIQVSWLDGKYYPYGMWKLSFCTVISDILFFLEDYADKHGIQ